MLITRTEAIERGVPPGVFGLIVPAFFFNEEAWYWVCDVKLHFTPGFKHCQYIFGDVKMRTWYFCNRAPEPGTPYCAEHKALCWIKDPVVAVAQLREALLGGNRTRAALSSRREGEKILMHDKDRGHGIDHDRRLQYRRNTIDGIEDRRRKEADRQFRVRLLPPRPIGRR